jgi:hypothetical protein
VKTNLQYRLLSRSGVVFAALAFATLSAHATELVMNGGFESLQVAGVSSEIGSAFGNAQNVTGWTTSGYNFVYVPGDPNANSQYGAGDVALWNSDPTTDVGGAGIAVTPSPVGGNFLAMDGSYAAAVGSTNGGAIQQTINGLVVGKTTTVSFYWGAAQQYTFTGPTTEQFEVSLGGQTDATSVLANVSHGFTGWQEETMTFTATSTSELLSIAAIGLPDSSEPPMALLDGVSVTQATPEPSSLALLATGLFATGGLIRSRFKKA